MVFIPLCPNKLQDREREQEDGSYGVWLAQGMLLKVINLPVSQMLGAGEGRNKGWKSPDNGAQGKAI